MSIKFGACLVDYPWRFNAWNRDTGSGRSADSHYQTQTMDWILSLDIMSMMLPNCAVFMWATMPMLPEALSVGESLGLKYKTAAFTWAKVTQYAWRKRTVPGHISDQENWRIGMGYWTRSNAELCLLFTRGRVVRKSKSVRQLVVAPIQSHSEKPDVHYRIEQLVDGPYLELFGRKPHPGWCVYGDSPLVGSVDIARLVDAYRVLGAMDIT